jgi:hypothetical protein
LLQRPETLEDDPHRDDRAKDYRQHQPAAGFDYLNHKDQTQWEKRNIQ